MITKPIHCPSCGAQLEAVYRQHEMTPTADAVWVARPDQRTDDYPITYWLALIDCPCGWWAVRTLEAQS